MRKDGKRSAGVGRWVVLASAAAVVVVAIGVWPSAEATPTRVERLLTVCTSPGGDCRKLIALHDLGESGSQDARDAISGLADSTDDKVALKAIAALGRRDFTSARGKIEAIYEDTERSETVRAAALSAYCRLQAADGRTWADVRGWVKTNAENSTRLAATYAALKAKYWPREAM